MGRVFSWPTVGVSGGFGLIRFQRVAAFGFFARQRNRRADAFGHEIHQTLHDPLVRIDPGARQHLAAITRPRPTGDLFRSVAILFIVGNCVIKGSKDNSGKEFARALTLFVIEGGAINEIDHLVVPVLILSFLASGEYDHLVTIRYCKFHRTAMHHTHSC